MNKKSKKLILIYFDDKNNLNLIFETSGYIALVSH